MRKIVLSILAFVLSFSYAKDFDKSGFLLGVFGGANSAEHTILGGNILVNKADFIPIGARLGFQSFNESGIFGTRFYVDYSYANAKVENTDLKLTQTLLGLNLDLLLDFNIPNTESFVGVFGGVNYGFYNFKSSDNISAFDGKGLGYNAELALTLSSNHRIEIFYKSLPFKKYEAGIFGTYEMTSITGLAYQYNF